MTNYEPAELVIFHAMWEDLHSKQEASQEWFKAWLDRLPTEGTYFSHARDLLRVCPVRYDDFHAWGKQFHDCVSFAIGKRPQKRLDPEHIRAIARLPWTKAKGGRSGLCSGCVQRRIR